MEESIAAGDTGGESTYVQTRYPVIQALVAIASLDDLLMDW